MNNELSILIKKHPDTWIEEAKTKPKEKLEYQLNKQMETFFSNSLLDLSQEGKGLLAVTSFEAKNSVFRKTDENNSFLVNIPGHWQTKSAEKTINELNNLLELRSRFGIELKDVRRR